MKTKRKNSYSFNYLNTLHHSHISHNSRIKPKNHINKVTAFPITKKYDMSNKAIYKISFTKNQNAYFVNPAASVR